MFDSLINIALVVFAFGFVIFWHELGHFLAARWAGVRVEQFAVGMGQALFSWRKGIGVRFAGFDKKGFHWGSTQAEFEKRIKAEYESRHGKLGSRELTIREQYDLAKQIGIGETEYRLSWVPLGGYVKPTGQDDLRPNKEVAADDPHAFGAKSVGKRMVIISAGVVMNVILAFALYMLLFTYGFNAPAPVAGSVSPGSPADRAGIRVGDRIVSINGDELQDFTKVQMGVALLHDGEASTFLIERAGTGKQESVQIVPVKTKQSYNMPAIGVGAPFTLEAANAKDRGTVLTSADQTLPPGSRISQINGQAVGPKDYHKLDAALRDYSGQPIELTITRVDGSTFTHQLKPQVGLYDAFTSSDLSFAGMRPRVAIEGVLKGSPADQAGVKPGDVVEQLAIVQTGETLRPPSMQQFQEWVSQAGAIGRTVRVTLLRNGETTPPLDIEPAGKWPWSNRTIGVMMVSETANPVVGEVLDNSSASDAGLRAGDRIVSIDGKAVNSWVAVANVLKQSEPGQQRVIVASNGSSEREVSLNLSKEDVKQASMIRYGHNLPLQQLIERRQTYNPITAASWGVTETKFSIVQVYLTLQRLIQRTVPVSNLSGPLGIFSAGASAADRGADWLIWFTALISANLAVVNFLPIPIVDGGLFLFLLAEKITGRPPSPRLQTAAQIVGLALLGSLFLFVTYHDVLRIFG